MWTTSVLASIATIQIWTYSVHMNQLDSAASERVLRAMAEAGIRLEDLAPQIGMHKKTLLRRLAQGPWKLAELGTIATVIGCPVRDLMPTEEAA